MIYLESRQLYLKQPVSPPLKALQTRFQKCDNLVVDSRA
jgi:hypothetical protein